MKDYKDKIKKLLALAESNNEHEARAALLKAKELMAEYKIEEIDLADAKNRKVKRVYTEHYWTKRGEFWIGSLASVIAENYCCKSASVIPYKGAQKREIFFVGLEDDVDLCAKIFDYAVESARKFGKLYLLDNYKNYDLTSQEKNRVKNSYAIGFSKGVKEAFEVQKEEQMQKEENGHSETGWGLVMAVPQEVIDECSSFTTDKYRSKNRIINCSIYNDGYKEGTRFNPNGRLTSVI